MSHTEDQISIRKYNEMLRDVILHEKLLPKDCSGKVTFYMELQNDTGEPRIIPKNYPCSSEYLEYFWVEFEYGVNEYVASLFYRDFDCKRGDIHVMPGVLQVWEKTPYSQGEEYKFPSGSQIEAYTQTVKVSDSENIIWKPLIDYGKMKSKKFVWAPNFSIDNLSKIVNCILSICTLKVDVSEIRISFNIDISVTGIPIKNEKLEALKIYMRKRAIKQLEKSPSNYPPYSGYGRNNYQYLYLWTSNFKINDEEYFISPYKHISADYGYFILFDGMPTAYMIKNEGKYPNEVVELKFVINYEYAPEEVNNASNN